MYLVLGLLVSWIMHVSLHSYAGELLWMGSCLPSTGMLQRCSVIGSSLANRYENSTRPQDYSCRRLLLWGCVALHIIASWHMTDIMTSLLVLLLSLYLILLLFNSRIACLVLLLLLHMITCPSIRYFMLTWYDIFIEYLARLTCLTHSTLGAIGYVSPAWSPELADKEATAEL